MADNPPNRSYRSDDRHGARSSARGGGAIGDPLAELARLIGQSDPFNGAGHGGPARAAAPKPPAAASPSSSPTGVADWREMAAAMRPFERLRDEPGETVAPDELPARSGPGEDRQGADGFEDIYADDRQYAHAETDDDPYYDEGAPTTPRDEDMYDDPRRPSRRSGLITAVMLIGCAMIGTAGAYAYRSYYVGSGSNRTLPVIAADTTPSKVVSSVDPQPTKSIQDRLRDQSQERVVSREEQPLELTNPPMPPAPRIGGRLGGGGLRHAEFTQLGIDPASPFPLL